MTEALLMAVWFGILTSISPCPLATNIAAVSFLSKKISRPSFVLLNGMIYTLGRAAFYTLLGVILSYFLSSIPIVSDFLQTKMSYIAGPIMIILGILLLDIISLKLPSFQLKEQSKEKLDKMGFIGSFAIGFLFASMLCPVSAAFFFSNLLQSNGNVFVLILYGFGTGLPVLLFAFVLAFCAEKISSLYKATTTFETYARKITAIIFIGVGIYSLVRNLI